MTSTASTRRGRTSDGLAALTVVVGAVLLWGTFHVSRGSAAFWLVGFTLAAVWVLGGVTAAPVVSGHRSIATLGVAGGVGVGAFVAFYVAYRIGRHIPVLSSALHGVVGTANAAHVAPVLLLAVVNAVAEEMFFRGALFTVAESRRLNGVAWSTVIYALVTAASFNVALVLAAVAMGALFAVLRRWSGGVVAPAVAHVVWSTLMLLALHR